MRQAWTTAYRFKNVTEKSDTFIKELDNLEYTPQKRVETALRGGRPDKIPFAVYENKLISSTTERLLRNRGMCVVTRRDS